MSKEFDCVKMKNIAAAKVQKKIAAFSTKKELAFWENQTASLRKRQRELTAKQKVKP